MILAFCIDDQGGLAFNHRRQSRDRAVCARILEDAAGRRGAAGILPALFCRAF